MAKFKKGDIVILTESHPQLGIKEGDWGIVDENDSGVPFVKWNGDKNNRWAISENDLQLKEKDFNYEIY